jgi:hypothetical protein
MNFTAGYVAMALAAVVLPLALAWGVLAWADRDRARKRGHH